MANTNVYTFVPNIIGFGRVVLGLASLFYMQTDPIPAMILYWLSAFLDAFDGMAARHFNQSTTFGAVLDMVSDRCTTVCLWIVLGTLYPRYVILFQLVVTLDIASHWYQMYSSLLDGKESHKRATSNPIIAWYYKKGPLFILCCANELFFMALYLMHFNIGSEVTIGGHTKTAWEWVAIATFAPTLLKHCISLLQLKVAASVIAAKDVEAILKREKEG